MNEILVNRYVAAFSLFCGRSERGISAFVKFFGHTLVGHDEEIAKAFYRVFPVACKVRRENVRYLMGTINRLRLDKEILLKGAGDGRD